MPHIKFALVLCAVIMLASCSSTVSDQAKGDSQKKLDMPKKAPCTSLRDPRCR